MTFLLEQANCSSLILQQDFAVANSPSTPLSLAVTHGYAGIVAALVAALPEDVKRRSGEALKAQVSTARELAGKYLWPESVQRAILVALEVPSSDVSGLVVDTSPGSAAAAAAGSSQDKRQARRNFPLVDAESAYVRFVRENCSRHDVFQQMVAAQRDEEWQVRHWLLLSDSGVV